MHFVPVRTTRDLRLLSPFSHLSSVGLHLPEILIVLVVYSENAKPLKLHIMKSIRRVTVDMVRTSHVHLEC
jgi:hypothetical protein